MAGVLAIDRLLCAAEALEPDDLAKGDDDS
jgi:hypothetical protein